MAENTTIGKYIKYSILGLKLAGLYADTDNLFRSKLYLIYTFIVNVVFVALYNLSQMMYVVMNFHDIQYILTHAYLAVTFTMCSAKTYIYVKNWPKIRHLFDQLDDDEFQPRNARQTRLFDEFFKAYYLIYSMFATMAALIITLWPLIRVLSKSRSLPFPYWVPFDYSAPWIFELVYLHQTFGLVCFLLANITLDSISFGFTSYISAACDLLSDTLSNMYEATEKRLEEEEGISVAMDETERHSKVMENTEDTLMYCIALHWKIIRFAEDVNSFFTVLIFLQFGSSLISICVTMYGLTMRAISTTQLGIAGIFMSGLLTELLFFCYFGQEVMAKSVNIGNALYDSPWVDGSRSFKNKLHFFMLRAQRPLKIRALNVFEMALPTFLWILRCSWSFYVFLSRTTHNKD